VLWRSSPSFLPARRSDDSDPKPTSDVNLNKHITDVRGIRVAMT